MPADPDPQRDGHVARPIARHRGGAQSAGLDTVAEEVPVALVFNGISHAVMMATPRDLEQFALGFALTEGVVRQAADVYDIEVELGAASAAVIVTIAQQDFMRLKQHRRTLAGRTGCGVCGIDSLELLDLHPEPMSASGLPITLAPALARASAELASHQALMSLTGGVHGAAWCAADGAIVKLFEDVGRHNAMDKLIGHLARERIDMRQGFVFMSSRASYELARKASRMHIPMLATISAPSSLAIDIAQRAGMKLVSFCRKDGFVDYTPALAFGV
ncbi:formate dehydrogenase family accessory protein FdhD [Janthinobacterium agaricidamnosum NBRC 102515 = DSM 9628]|uniref:Sulfur carrier protein FdhD n=2 Tax=Janthinobacterium agaricidamnosum TaxID=55508 RepID=W0V898_9BURK|nr:formate dehydrogenase accessory sulfurtransferase FdhD [Janthinobacterium agaricidamnosum]CDG83840.1 formate dehydrogenase family accessory protein FdhD [Janthinobacterium agaricidamnosum NBRC 102515 = DSM 9628]